MPDERLRRVPPTEAGARTPDEVMLAREPGDPTGTLRFTPEDEDMATPPTFDPSSPVPSGEHVTPRKP